MPPQAGRKQGAAMALGIAVAIALLAGSQSAAPSNPATADPSPAGDAADAAPPEPPPRASSADARCVTPLPDADTHVIVVCAERPQGYRINRDVMEAHRESHSAGRPTPRETLKDDSCKTVGPMGCRGIGTGINVLAAAATLARMADRLSKGEEIGSMFVTTPEPTEYELYVAAKKRREAEEAAAKAKKASAAAGQ
jgi:hypothetical protein